MGDLDGDSYDEFAIGCNGYANFDGLVSVFLGSDPFVVDQCLLNSLFILGPYGWGTVPGRPSRWMTQ